MQETPVATITISNKVLMEFYSVVFRLYPNITRIQEVIDEDAALFSCTFTFREDLSPSQEEEIHGSLLELIQQRILPVLPVGYRSTLGDVILEMPEKTEDVIVSDFCAFLQKKFSDITEIAFTIIGDTVAFSIAGNISPRIKYIIRQTLIAEFPLWDEYQPRDPVFYPSENIPSQADEVSSDVLSRIASLLSR